MREKLVHSLKLYCDDSNGDLIVCNQTADILYLNSRIVRTLRWERSSFVVARVSCSNRDYSIWLATERVSALLCEIQFPHTWQLWWIRNWIRVECISSTYVFCTLCVWGLCVKVLNKSCLLDWFYRIMIFEINTLISKIE